MVLAAILIVPDKLSLELDILVFPSWATWSILSAVSFRMVPALVTSTPFAVRLKSSALKYFSNAAMWLLTVPWLVLISLAANEKLRVLATVRKVLR
jgi:hypothetical protein